MNEFIGKLLKKHLPYLCYLILVIYIFQFRYKLDINGPYFTSDGAIKIYQTFQYKEKGLLSQECYYPGKKIDPDFLFFPISYPWAIFSKQLTKQECVFEYPPFFFWFSAFILNFISLKFLLYLPLVFYAISIFFFDYILRSIGLFSLFRIFIVLLSFFTFPMLTAIDFTENPLFMLLYLLGFLFFSKAIDKEKANIQQRDNHLADRKLIISGILIGISFFFRLEILISFAAMWIVFFLRERNVKSSLYFGFAFTLTISLFLVYNLFVSGHILGFRYVSSIDLNENAKADIFQRFEMLKAYLWGDKLMKGIFAFNPICFLALGLPVIQLIRKQSSNTGNLFLSAGILSLVSIPLYVTVYGGVGYFGLRYLEPSFYLMIIGFSYYLKESKILEKKRYQTFFFVLFSLLTYWNLVTTREGLKVLRSSSADVAHLYSSFNPSKEYIIHTSLFTSIWMGRSYLDKTHLLATDSKALNTLLEKIPVGEDFVLVKSPKEIYISTDIPKSLYSKYMTNITLPLDKLRIISEEEKFGLRFYHMRREVR